MKRALIIATVWGFISSFEKNDIKILKELGYKIIVASNFQGYRGDLADLDVEILDIPIARSPISLNNIKAFFTLRKYLLKNKIDLIHCHTPVGGVLGRIVGKIYRIKKVIYTAHGFHFYKGANLANWLLFYPVEKILSKFTDVLIVINSEDYEIAKRFYSKKLEYIPGVGLDTKAIRELKVNREIKRKELGLKDDDIVLLSVGELNNNKNHIIPIKALSNIKNENIVYLIAGKGSLKDYLEEQIKNLGLKDKVKLLGYRTDVYELCKIADIYIFPSKREGLGLAALEAMASGLPLICSSIRGINDYAEDNKTGYCIDKDNIDKFTESLEKLINFENLREKFGKYNEKKVLKFDINNVEKNMRRIYGEKNE